MKAEPADKAVHKNKARLLTIAILAPLVALGAWFLWTALITAPVPDDFPNLPDVQSLSSSLRDVLVSADKEARKEPGSPEVVGRLGIVYHANQFFEEADSAYKIAARLAPDDYQWPYARAVLAEESGRAKEELELLEELVAL